MPQPHKGDRTYVSTRVRTVDYERLCSLAERNGETKSDILNRALVEYLARADLAFLRATKEAPVGRPYKEHRVGVTAKIPRAYFEKLDRITQTTGQTKNDFVAALIIEGLDMIEVQAMEDTNSQHSEAESSTGQTHPAESSSTEALHFSDGPGQRPNRV